MSLPVLFRQSTEHESIAMIDLSPSRTRRVVTGLAALVRASQTVSSRPKPAAIH